MEIVLILANSTDLNESPEYLFRCLFLLNMLYKGLILHLEESFFFTDKQKALMRDCIYNIENTDLEIEVSGIYLHLLKYFDTHRCSSPTVSFYALRINLLKYNYPKVITQRLWHIYRC